MVDLTEFFWDGAAAVYVQKNQNLNIVGTYTRQEMAYICSEHFKEWCSVSPSYGESAAFNTNYFIHKDSTLQDISIWNRNGNLYSLLDAFVPSTVDKYDGSKMESTFDRINLSANSPLATSALKGQGYSTRVASDMIIQALAAMNRGWETPNANRALGKQAVAGMNTIQAIQQLAKALSQGYGAPQSAHSITVRHPQLTESEQRKRDGLCIQCGDTGEWRTMMLMCRNGHGRIAG